MPYAIIESLTHEGAKTVTKVRKHRTDTGVLETIFSAQYCSNLTIKEVGGSFLITYDNLNWSPNITQRWEGPFNIGDACLVPVLNGDVGFNLISSMYVIAYTFGMMARYYPSSWIALRRVEKGDKIYPLIQRSLNFIEEKLPLVALDFLRSPYNIEFSPNKSLA